jgi:copper chaperone
MDTTTYRVTGMTCGGCVKTLTRALEQALPDAEVEVQLEGGLVRIRGTHALSDVSQAVEDAGFDMAPDQDG